MSNKNSRLDEGKSISADSWVVLCDFDGTVSKKDVGNRLFARFAGPGWKDVVRSWKKGRIGSRDCLVAECALTRATPDQVSRFALTQEIDPHFKRFIHYCHGQGVLVAILSDGLDFYIDLLLEKYGLEDLPRFANHLEFHGSKLVPSFPYFLKGCRRCGNCKGYHVRRYQQNGSRVIYIGDGFSDRCGVRDADLVFAKGDLRQYCRQRGIRHLPFQDFSDLLELIPRWVEKGQTDKTKMNNTRREQ